MRQRRTQRSRSSRMGRPSALLLAGLLLAVSGPGVAAWSAPRTSRSSSLPAQIQGDPVADLASDLEYDATRIFRYVADEIRYEPYPGVLRGARGTLEAGAGNSVDKALLLGALLDASLIEYRFARGPLDASSTAELVSPLATDIAGARAIAMAPLTRGLEQVLPAGASPLPSTGPDPLAEQAGAAEAAAARRLEEAETRLGATTALIEGALETAGIGLPRDGDLALPSTETTDHTWLQMRSGSGWRDLDPSLAGAQPGWVMVPAAETLDRLPDELRYQVAFHVLAERMNGGQLVTDDLLTYTGFADELAGSPITLGHVTPSGLKAIGLSLASLLGDGWLDYRPALQVAGRSFVADEAVAFPLDAGGDSSGPFDVLDPASSPGTGPSEGEATAEWLEVRVTPPGSAPDVARRTIFDRLPPDRRAAGDVTPEAVRPAELVDFRGNGTLDFLPMLGVRTFAVATGPTSVEPLMTHLDDPLGTFALAYHNLRDSMAAELALDAGARSYIDGPDIVSLTVDVVGDATAHTTRAGLDILRRDHGILPLSGQSIGAARSQIVAGVIDHVAERVAVEGMAGAPGAPPSTIGVSDIFEQAADMGIPTVTLQGTSSRPLPYGAAASTLIGDALASGDIVVIPAQPVTVDGRERVGWWQVDPATGATADVMDDGTGAEMGEYTVIVESEIGQLICMGSMAMAAAEVIIASATLLGSFYASSMYRLFLGGVGDTSCV